jgi:hypothetical protein
VLSGWRHDILTTHRARLQELFQAAVAEVTGEMEDGDWDQGPSMSAAFMLDQGGGWAAPTGWVGHGGSFDGSRTNPWYGMFLKSGWTGWEREAVTPIRQGQRGSGGADNYSGWGTAFCGCVRTCGAWRAFFGQRRTDPHPQRIDRSEAARGRARPRN